MHHTGCAGITLILIAFLPQSSPGETAKPATPAELVQRLGDDSCEVREEAGRQLQRLGRAAVAALKAGLASPDREIRGRCRDLLPLASRSDLDIDLDNFVSGQRDAKAAPLIGWSAFAGWPAMTSQRASSSSASSAKTGPCSSCWIKAPPALPANSSTGCGRVQQKFQVLGANKSPAAQAGAEINGMLLAACLANVDLNNFYQVSNVFYLQTVRAEIAGNAGLAPAGWPLPCRPGRGRQHAVPVRLPGQLPRPCRGD